MGPFVGLSSPPVWADVPQTGCYKRDGLEPKVAAALEEFRASVPALMGKGDIPAPALALVDDQGIVWTEGFGHIDGKKTEPVTPDTPFMICGMSKLITGTAVMLAVQEGSVKLDEPVTTYLPDFQMNSRYEEHPEGKITLRLLLSFAAGLPMAMPLGNSFEPASSAPFEEHVKSLYGSWMVCPVGRNFYYSDASVDLAAYVIRMVAGKPFKDYLHEKLFGPLGMSNTTADRSAILNNPRRAIGHMMGIAKLPAVYPGLGSDGIYSSARDMARLVQLYINRGMLDGHAFVQRSLLDTISTPVGIARTDPNQYYGQGVFIGKRLPEKTETGSPTRETALGAPTVFWHDGLGFGLMSLLYWYPEYGIGMVVLTNRLPHPVLEDLALGLTDKLVKGKLLEKRFPQAEPDYHGCLRRLAGLV